MQNKQSEFLDLKQAAALAGVNRMTIWRAVVQGVIEQLAQPEQPQSGKKRAILVRRESLLGWMAERDVQPVQGVLEQLAQIEHVTSQPEQVAQSLEHETPITPELAFQVINKALDRAGQAEQRLERALARIEQAERQTQALSLELQSYKRVLTEQAESLAEERAHRLTLEQQQLKVDTPKASGAGWGSRWKRFLGLKTGSG